MFLAHHIAEWLGIPAGIVIAVMFIARKQGRDLLARRRQARDAGRASPGSTTFVRHPARGRQVGQLDAGPDAELGEHVPQVRVDRVGG